MSVVTITGIKKPNRFHYFIVSSDVKLLKSHGFNFACYFSMYFNSRFNPNLEKFKKFSWDSKSLQQDPGTTILPNFWYSLTLLQAKTRRYLNIYLVRWTFNLFSLSDRFSLTAEYAKKYGPIYRMWIGSNFPEVRILRCDFAEEIFRSSKFIEKSPTYSLLRPWLGDGLISSTGKKNITRVIEWTMSHEVNVANNCWLWEIYGFWTWSTFE